MSLSTSIILLTIVFAVTVFTVFLGSEEIGWPTKLSTAGIILLIFLALSTAQTVTTVDQHGVSLRRRFSFNYGWPFGTIDRAEIKSYREATDEHGRLALMLSGMHILHDDGVLMHLNSGKLAFISSKRANELVDAISTGLAVFERRKYE